MPNDQPEPLSAILAEMRDPPHKWEGFSRADLARLADRVEAAAEREREKQNDECNEAFDNGCQFVLREMPEGNVAAMREALEVIANEIRIWRASIVGITPDERRLLNVARCALAAPARNCDRFATAEEARKAFEEEHSCEIVHNLYTAAFDWLFAEAEGGDHA